MKSDISAPLRVVGRIRIYPEICCEECGDVIHNHFDCPACGMAYAPSDRYCPLYKEAPPVRMSCEKCGAMFQLVSGGTFDGEWALSSAQHQRSAGVK